MGLINHKAVFNLLEAWAPKSLAYDWDNVGLQIGSMDTITKGILITLDVTESIIDEAIQAHANLIIAHHPLLFSGIKVIDTASPKGKVIKKLMEHNITVYAAHTNLDIAQGGVNDLLCEALHINVEGNLEDIHAEKLYKLAVYVPKDYSMRLKSALGDAGAGYVGNYSNCSFESKGTGTFKPEEGANPFIGKESKLEIVEEVKVETIIKECDIQSVIHAMKQAHPYEEVAYDLYVLENQGETLGIGRIGSLNRKMSLAELCQQVKSTFELQGVRVTGDLTRQVSKIAVLGGSGNKFISQALKLKADVYITGDVTFHFAQDAREAGLAIIDAGHYIEKIMKKATVNYLVSNLTETNMEIIESKINTDPFRFV